MPPPSSRLDRLASHVVAAPQPAAAPSTKVGFGIVGAGDIAKQSFAPALMGSAEAELVACCRRDVAQAREFAAEHGGGCAAYGTTLDLLADPAVTAVIIATPTHTHAELCLLAAAHGKHVLVEKPMARDVAECQQMIAACEAAGVSLGVCYRRRTFPQVVKAKELIAAGAIGDVLTVRTHCSALQDTLKSGRSGFSEEWASEPVLGGAMMEMASHRIEVLLNFMDRPPQEVSALVETVHPDHQGWQADDSDALLVLYDFSAMFRWEVPLIFRHFG